MHNSSSKSLLMLLLLIWLTASTVVARPVGQSQGSRSSTLMSRLKLDEVSPGSGPGAPSCWDSLFQLQSCTGEVLLFFLNGETYLGPGCCSAIRVIQKQCWPSMLGSLGFTAEEGDILQGYCEASAATTDTPPPAPTVKS